MNPEYESCLKCVYRKNCHEYNSEIGRHDEIKPRTHEEVTEWLPSFTIDEMVQDLVQF